jgi:hypothetical protein
MDFSLLNQLRYDNECRLAPGERSGPLNRANSIDKLLGFLCQHKVDRKPLPIKSILVNVANQLINKSYLHSNHWHRSRQQSAESYWP